jgi:RNA polymerase sigma-70 factor (ECF subfamily)
MLDNRNFGLSDEDFLRLTKGDARLQTRLFDKHALHFVTVARKFNVSLEDAEEIVSSAFAKLFCKILANAVEKQNLEGYVYTIIKNKCFEYTEAQKKNILKTTDIMPEVIDNETDTAFLPALNAAFNRLGEKCQKLLSRFYWEDKDHKDIAHEWGITEEASRQRKRECMKKLRLLMGGQQTVEHC